VTEIVILGGGMVAGFAAQEMASAGLGDAHLTIVSADTEPPYHRPPLSKGFLAGEEDADEILINEPAFYEHHGITLRLGTRIDAVDFDARTLTTGDGETLGFDRLLIATGATPRRLPVPGGELAGIHTLRRLDDSRAIRDALGSVRRAVVGGGSFLGTEVASVLADQGVDTTLVYRGERLLARLFTPEMSRYTEEIFREHRVTLVPSSEVVRFHGDASVEAVELAGSERLDADLVVLAVGVSPATGLFSGSTLRLDDGVVVDPHLATPVDGVWAAGDVARFPDPLDPSRETLRRLEHWDNAVEQGRLAGRNLLSEDPDQARAYDRLPYFFSDAFDLSWELWGDPELADEVVIRGRIETGRFGAWWLRDSRVVAVFLMNRPDDEREVAQSLIQSGRRQSPAQLRNLDVALVAPAAGA